MAEKALISEHLWRFRHTRSKSALRGGLVIDPNLRLA
jgi:hypothetical protein